MSLLINKEHKGNCPNHRAESRGCRFSPVCMATPEERPEAWCPACGLMLTCGLNVHVPYFCSGGRSGV